MRRDEGFSLTELTVVLVLIGFILGAAWMLMQTASSTANWTEATSIASEEARNGIDIMSTELRQAQEVTEGAGFMSVMATSQITFYTDVHHDGRPDRVTYYKSGSNLMRRETSATRTFAPYTFNTPEASATILVRGLSAGYTGPIFTYWTDAEPSTISTQVVNTSAIAVRIVDSARSGTMTATVDVSTWVKIRAVHNTLN
jgi:prepilin-type N-terminal cleavage/methylation domain-containing protein